MHFFAKSDSKQAWQIIWPSALTKLFVPIAWSHVEQQKQESQKDSPSYSILLEPCKETEAVNTTTWVHNEPVDQENSLKNKVP